MHHGHEMHTLSVARLRERYLQGETTPAAVIREIIERVHADADMNIWITQPSLEAIQPYLERLADLDPTNTPLWGIPFAVKDNIDVAGLVTTAGCPDYGYMPTEPAAVVERLVAAGAIPIGKTNLDQFATGLVGTRSPYGETHNALRGEFISGGSSSGSAVAVARGHAAFALGTDTAGSGRVPAALNRLIGYKPSLGAWPTKGVVPACASLDCVTVFAHTLEDALAVDEIVRGPHDADPWSRDVTGWTAGMRGSHSLARWNPVQPSRILLPKAPLEFFGQYAVAYEKAWQAAAKQCSVLGIPVEYVDVQLFSDAAAILYEGPWVAERWASLGDFVDSHPGATFPITEQILRSGTSSSYDAASVFRALHRLQAFKLEARRLLHNAVLVMPTAGGTWTRDQVRQDPIGTNRDMGRYTNHCNLLDLCAVAIPAGDAAPEIPFGITLFGLPENEAVIFGAAERFMAEEMIRVAVCGLHMRGYPLEKQMRDHDARFIGEASTASKYQLVKLPAEPAKPGLIKRASGGLSIQIEIWEMPVTRFGAFAALIPAPLGIGKVELADGSELPGFVCEAYAADDAEDITAFGGWRNVPGL